MSDQSNKLIPLTVTKPELLDNGTDKMFREMIHNALAFTARLESLRSSYGKVLGLAGSEYTILISIAHLQEIDTVGVSRVANHLMLTGAFVTSEVNKLVEKGYVDKAVNPKDKRRVLLTVTKSGRNLLTTLAPVQQQVNNVHFGSISRKEFEVLHKLFPEMAKTTEEALSLLSHLSRSIKKN